jgi:hypothetical protein
MLVNPSLKFSPFRKSTPARRRHPPSRRGAAGGGDGAKDVTECDSRGPHAAALPEAGTAGPAIIRRRSREIASRRSTTSAAAGSPLRTSPRTVLPAAASAPSTRKSVPWYQ